MACPDHELRIRPESSGTDRDPGTDEIVGFRDIFVGVIAKEPRFTFDAIPPGWVDVSEDRASGDLLLPIIGLED